VKEAFEVTAPVVDAEVSAVGWDEE